MSKSQRTRPEALTREVVLATIKDGASYGTVAKLWGVTRSTIAGIAYRAKHKDTKYLEWRDAEYLQRRLIQRRVRKQKQLPDRHYKSDLL